MASKSAAYNTLMHWKRLKSASSSGRWVLTCFRWGSIRYYRGSKNWPTIDLANAHTYATSKAAAKNTKFMHSGADYRPMQITDKLVFKGMLVGSK